MGLVDRYRTLDDLPGMLAVFPLPRVLLLPRAQLPLNVFEPRYLALVDTALATSRVIGMIQPTADAPSGERPPLAPVGTAGRITAYSETPDGRCLVTLTGIARFRVAEEITSPTPYRVCRPDFAPFAADLEADRGAETVDRDRLIATLEAYLDARRLEVNWDEVHSSSTEALVNALAILSPYGASEKQALLEAPDLSTRAEILIALTEMELGHGRDGGTALQ